MTEIEAERQRSDHSSPTHVGIIMDGNGRWARARNLPRIAGHRAGVEVIGGLLEAAVELGIEYLSLFAFSTENWSRPAEEVRALMRLLAGYLDSHLQEVSQAGIRLLPVGDIGRMPEPVRQQIERAQHLTAENRKLTLVLAVNYGGRADILQAVRALAQSACQGRIDPDRIGLNDIAARLQTSAVPDPDLIIRTSGESRLSNFYLWQAAYSELWITETYWPDFTPDLLRLAVADYARRQRRFGGLPREDQR